MTVPQITTRLVVGPANNQLPEDRLVDVLARRGIMWIPDYVASADGIVYTLSRESENFDHEAAYKRVESTGDIVSRLLTLAQSAGNTPLQAARQFAGRGIKAAVSQV
ncbi:hypothetical protein AB0L67_40870 [Streptomyces flaveolus]|uniref:hypothetical protein n=1 Tax=Streptomyces flaveolus TaxID=67297 RepID=UPI003431EABD